MADAKTKSARGRKLLLLGAAALLAACALQRHIERRRVAVNLVWADPGKKETLEAGFMALGGFRGVLVDILWLRAIRQQEAGRLYEHKLICDMIQNLQPTFVQVHAFQGYNMIYNLASKSETCEDKWYWIRSGIQAYEKGLERNERNHGMWFELGFVYLDRLDDRKLIDKAAGIDCRGLRLAELPRIDELDETQRKKVFSEPDKWVKGHARNDEHLRFAAYYFYKALQTNTDTNPVRVERIYGNTIDNLGHFRSKNIPPEQRKWDDWGAEEWWLEMTRRNDARGNFNEPTAPQNLQFTMMKQMNYFDNAARSAKTEAERVLNSNELSDAHRRYGKYFPAEKRTLAELLEYYRKQMETVARNRG